MASSSLSSSSLQGFLGGKNVAKRRRLDFVPAKASNGLSSSTVILSANKSTAPSATTSSAANTTANPTPVSPTATANGHAKSNASLFDSKLIQERLHWQSVHRVGPGFFNEGNSCYLNSTLQCLLYLPPLAQLLQSESPWGKKKAIMEGSGRPILDIFQSLVKEVHNGQSSRAISPKAMVANIRRVSKQFKAWRQEDAHEYLRELLDVFVKEILSSHGYPSLARHQPIAETTLISRIFGGQLTNLLACSRCGYLSKTMNFCLDLSLEVGAGITSVQQALQQFSRVEHLSHGNEWRCDHCHQKVQATKQLVLSKAPPVLVLHLKRFGWQGGKISKHISFPLLLNLPVGGGVTGGKSSSSAAPTIEAYELTAVLVHYGHSSHAGHYIAFVKSSNGQWHEMNDSNVRVVSVQSVLQAQAYILFYTKASAAKTNTANVPTATTTSITSSATVTKKTENGLVISTTTTKVKSSSSSSTVMSVSNNGVTAQQAVVVEKEKEDEAFVEDEEEDEGEIFPFHMPAPYRFQSVLKKFARCRKDLPPLRSIATTATKQEQLAANEDEQQVASEEEDDDDDSEESESRDEEEKVEIAAPKPVAAAAASVASAPASVVKTTAPVDKVAHLLAMSRRGRLLGGEGMWEHLQTAPELQQQVEQIGLHQRRQEQKEKRSRAVSDWDSLLDQGHQKKVKVKKEEDPQAHLKGNPFQRAGEDLQKRKEKQNMFPGENEEEEGEEAGGRHNGEKSSHSLDRHSKKNRLISQNDEEDEQEEIDEEDGVIGGRNSDHHHHHKHDKGKHHHQQQQHQGKHHHHNNHHHGGSHGHGQQKHRHHGFKKH